MPLGLPGLRGLLLAGSRPRKLGTNLSLSGRLAPGVADALVHPGALRPRPLLQLAAGFGVLLECLAGMPPGDLTLLQVGGVAAAVDADLLLRQVDLDDPGHRAGQELPVVADQHRRRRADRRRTPPAGRSPSRSRSLVGSSSRKTSYRDEQQRGQPGPGRLATGQAGHRRVQVDARGRGRPRPPRPARRGRRRRGRASAPARRRTRRRRRRRRRRAPRPRSSIACVAAPRRSAGPGIADRLARAPLGSCGR